jgi:hypothetical protein
MPPAPAWKTLCGILKTTMRQRKIRGHHRRQKQIERWRNHNLTLDIENLLIHKKDYVKIWVHPWSGLSMKNSSYPEPNGQTKSLIVNALFDIYENWKKQIEQVGQSYYLKIWLYEPRVSKSQVVCAIGDKVDHYDNIFNVSNKKVDLNVNSYSKKTNSKLSAFSWKLHLDEDYFDSSETENAELVFIEKGIVWVGGK